MADNLAAECLESARFHFRLYKRMAEGALRQLRAEDFAWQPNSETNSVQIIMQHLHGNMISRWTDFLTADGEKPTRDRDGEFIGGGVVSREELRRLWESGWECLLAAVDALAPDDLLRTVTIRGQKMTALEAINRQLTHVAYHVGQIVQIGKERLGTEWKTLSIPRGQSSNLAAITGRSENYRGTPGR